MVKVNTFIRSINDIDDYKMEFSVQITFREQWNDMRLKFDDAEGEFIEKKIQILSKKNGHGLEYSLVRKK